VTRSNFRLTRFAVAILAIASCFFLIQASARFGFSRLLGRFAVMVHSLPAADEAVLLAPSDPEAHRTRARVLSHLKKPAEASEALESATSLRYRDDYLWFELGHAREEAGDAEGALAAFDQAVLWAPHYAHTRWQRGNLLLRLGRSAEAFEELRKGAAVNQMYVPNLIDLAWGISRGDARSTEELTGIKNDRERIALIRFLARKGKGKELVQQLSLLATPLSDETKRELIQSLLAAKAFREAVDVWTGLDQFKINVPAVFNGGFEEQLLLDNTGLGGWAISPEQTKSKLSQDVSQKLGGTKSLQIRLEGDWTPGTPLLSQTLLVEPAQTYRVSFGVLTKDLATGGPPVITVSDATTDRLLGKSEGFPSTNSWLTLNFEFTTLPTSEAVVIRLQRNNCDSSPCPIFGVVWLDEIRIEQTRSATNH
jgi:tetratricopeptide (TPR) repeat protein